MADTPSATAFPVRSYLSHPIANSTACRSSCSARSKVEFVRREAALVASIARRTRAAPRSAAAAYSRAAAVARPWKPFRPTIWVTIPTRASASNGFSRLPSNPQRCTRPRRGCGADRDDRDLHQCQDPLTDLAERPAIDDRHHKVEQDQLRPIPRIREEVQGSLSVRGADGSEPLTV
jgi:hypothetical protein